MGRLRKILTMFLFSFLLIGCFFSLNIPQVKGAEESANEFLTAKKQIDFLGDSQKNTDTTLVGNDYYRLYLDILGTTTKAPTDFVILLDNSMSMDDYYFSADRTRYDALMNVLKGTSAGELGLINKIFESNKENRVSIHSFGYLATIRSDWKTLSDLDVNNDGMIQKEELDQILSDEYNSVVTGGATNIESGLWSVRDQMLKKRDGHEQMVLFLSDGLPTLVNTKEEFNYRYGNIPEDWGLYSSFENGYTRMSGREMFGNISGDSINSEDRMIKGTISAADILKESLPNVTIATIFMNEDSSEAGKGKEFLDNVATNPSLSYAASNIQELTDSFDKLIGLMSGVKIVDELSPYVDFYQEQADLLVIKTEKNGQKKFIPQEEYELILPTSESKKVEIKFLGGLSVDSTYTLSFNVKVNQLGKEQYVSTAPDEQKYGDAGIIGDRETDYQGNQTSSEKIGLPANKEASVQWQQENIDGTATEYKYDYKHPVVQVIPVEALVTGNKKIDYLGDGIPNLDTQLVGAEDYRLYLAATDETKYPQGDEQPAIRDLKISDQLSPYTRLDLATADIRVTRKLPEEQRATLLPPSDYQFVYNERTKTIQVLIEGEIPQNAEYILSYNIKTTEQVTIDFWTNIQNDLEPYANNKGQEDTDYEGNTTSSLKAGFNANEKAELSWLNDGELKSMSYKHPVVQPVLNGAINVVKESDGEALAGAEFKLVEALVDSNGNWNELSGGKTWTGVTAIDVTSGKAQYRFDNLPEGRYLLTETKAPAGHSLLAKAVEITLPYKDDGSGLATTNEKGIVKEDGTYYYELTYTIKNNKVFRLPDTGGVLRIVFFYLGVVTVTIGLGAWYFYRKYTNPVM